MKSKQLLTAWTLGLGLTLVLWWGLDTGSARMAHAASFTVTKFTDSNDGACDADCSLREAIVAANAAAGPDTINLSAGTYTLSLTGAGEDAAASGDLDINGDLTITGVGPGATVIDASALSDRALQVRSGTVLISGVQVRNGGTGAVTSINGGAILNAGTLTLLSVTVSGSVASFGDGGGIFNAGTLTVMGATVSGNTTGATFGSGGGIYNQGRLAMTNAIIAGNSVFEAAGGGIYNAGALDMSDSTVRDNGNAGFFGPGGGIFNSGTLTITRSTVRGNVAYSPGGGISNGTGGNLSIINTTVFSNSAAGGGGGIANSGALTLTGAVISANRTFTTVCCAPAVGGGGIFNDGTLALNASTVTGNSTDDEHLHGGGISNSGNLMLAHSTVNSNTAAWGAGVFNASGVLALTESAVSSNVAFGETRVAGGGIYNDGGVVTLTGSILNANSASGPFFPGFDAPGGGILNAAGQLALTDSAVRDNSAFQGGGIRNEGGTLLLTASTVNSNTALGLGGGIWNTGGTLTVTDTTVSGNGASDGPGGGIYTSQGTLRLTNSTVSSNTAYTGGGGVFNASGALTLTNSTLSGNRVDAFSGGGGLENDSGTVTLIKCTVNDNQAFLGGGLWNGSGTLTLRNTIVAHNPSGGDCSGAITSAGHNLDSDGTCNLSATGDITGTDPLLDPLQNNGGRTETHALLPGSPAIDAADNAACPATDQRGQPRPQDGDGDSTATCDIGAYEVEMQSAKTANKPVAWPGDPLTFTIAFQNKRVGTASFRVTDTLPVLLTYVDDSLSANRGSYGQQGGVITWAGALNAGDFVTITFGAVVSTAAPMGTSIVNSAVISGGDVIVHSTTVQVGALSYLPIVWKNP